MSHRNLLFLTKCLLPFSLFEPLDAEERRIMQEHPVGYIPSRPRDHIQSETETTGKAQSFASRAPMSNRLRELVEQMRKEKPG